MRVRSRVTDRIYDPMEMIYLVNPRQIAMYLKHGATLYDLFESEGKLTAAFSRKETGGLYDLWKKHELC